jgi:hypothetical protein
MQVNNVTAEGNQTQNQVKTNLDLVDKAILKRIDPNSVRFNETYTDRAYMCIQLNINNTEKTCKVWTNDELRRIFLNIFRQDDELNQYLSDLF